MGRIFEVRKSTMFARWDRMAKQFTRIGKEIAIAVKAGGPNQFIIEQESYQGKTPIACMKENLDIMKEWGYK